jgi:hypothetical protein
MVKYKYKAILYENFIKHPGYDKLRNIKNLKVYFGEISDKPSKVQF